MDTSYPYLPKISMDCLSKLLFGSRMKLDVKIKFYFVGHFTQFNVTVLFYKQYFKENGIIFFCFYPEGKCKLLLLSLFGAKR